MIDIISRIKCISKKSPEKIAHIYNQQKTTYQELWNYSDKLALYLQLNSKTKSPVGILGDKSSDVIISILACMKAGLTYIPIGRNTPFARIKNMLDQAKSNTIITTESDVLVGYEINSLTKKNLDNIYNDAHLDPKHYLVPTTTDYIQYILFTSGTTGLPKGVLIKKSNVENYIGWLLSTYYPDDSSFTFVNQSSISFDFSVAEIFCPLSCGGTIFSVPAEIVSDAKAYIEYLASNRNDLSVLSSTPSLLTICCQNPNFSKKIFPNLKQIVSGGEVLPKKLAFEILNKFPNTIFSNTYGPTEATGDHTHIDLDFLILEKYKTVPIGRAKTGSGVFLLENEIILTGPNVSPGYLDMPASDSDRFFSYLGQHAYRSGDFGHFEDGLLFFDGRKDEQIKIHGHRVELLEVEFQIRLLPEVLDCCIIPQTTDGKVNWLCCFASLKKEITSNQNFEIQQSIKKNLKKFLPTYMIPRKFVFLDRLPTMANGKVDRSQLRKQLELSL